MKRLGTVFLTLALAAAGGLLFAALSLPAAFLTGSAAAVMVAVLLGVRTSVPEPLRFTCFAVLGILMSTAITPEALATMVELPLALAGLLVVIAGATAASYLVLRRFGGWDPLTALCGSIPGNFTVVMAVSLATGARMEQVVTAQVMRLFILVVFIPFAFGGGGSGVRSAVPEGAGPVDIVITLAIALSAAFVATRLKVPAGSFLGPLVVGTVLSAFGLVRLDVPAWLTAAALVVLGATIAGRLHGISREGLARMLAASLASFVAAFAVALAASILFAHVLDEPVGEMFLAYAPGGLDAMIALSFLLGYDVALVAILHAARMITLSILIPLGVGLVGRRGTGRT
jgi:membrane AbrB-like protein